MAVALDLREPPLEIAPFGAGTDAFERPPVAARCLVGASEAAQQVGFGRPEQVVVRKFAAPLEVGDEREPGCGTVGHRNRDRAVELDDRPRPRTDERLIVPRDRAPIGCLGAPRARVFGDNRRLQRIRTRRLCDQRI